MGSLSLPLIPHYLHLCLTCKTCDDLTCEMNICFCMQPPPYHLMNKPPISSYFYFFRERESMHGGGEERARDQRPEARGGEGKMEGEAEVGRGKEVPKQV